MARAVRSSASSIRAAAVGDEAEGRYLLLHLAADVGRVPRRPTRTQPGQDTLDNLVAVDGTDRRRADHQGQGGL
jgi:hypothetical protein